MARHAKLEMFKPKNLAGKKFYALALALLMVFSVVLFAGLLQVMGNNTAALSGHQSITSMVSQVWGWNGSAWDAAVITLTPASYQITAAFPNHFSVTKVIVVTANSSYNAKNILANSYLYSNTKIAITASTGATSSLNSAYAYVGKFINSTATSSFNDKAITQSLVNETLYAGGVNNLGLPVEYSVLQLFNTLPSAVPLYEMTLTTSTNATSHVSIAFTNYLTSPYNFNLITMFSETIFVIFATSAVITLFYSAPKHRGD